MNHRGALGDPDGDLSDSDGYCNETSMGLPGKEGKEQPIFLRKTYQMLETCPSHIACWADSGESFFIKDPDAFAQKVIPQFFAHSNFSSFVRQLNFYGFRKVKNDAKSQHSSRWWEFKHQKFVRGKQHLLSQIRRATHGANNEHEVNQLKTELCQLKGQMEEMSSNIEKLTSLVNDLMVDKMRREFPEPHKKRKAFSPYGEMDMDVDPAMAGLIKSEYEPPSDMVGGAADPFYDPSTDMSQDQRSFDLISDADDEFSAFVEGLGGASLYSAFDPARQGLSRSSSLVGLWGTGGSAGNVVGPQGASGPANESSQVAVAGEESRKQEDEEMSALEQSLFNLSPELQEKLVQTLVSKLGSEVEQTETTRGPAGSLATAAGNTACKDAALRSAVAASVATVSAAGGAAPQADGSGAHAPVALPLASAVLGAFLTQYAHTHLTHEPIGKPHAGGARKGIRTQG